jgi:cell filamentation protein
LAELNTIHPFREGNGRTQLSYLYLLGQSAGLPLDMARVRAVPMLQAMIVSFRGSFHALIEEISHLCP